MSSEFRKRLAIGISGQVFSRIAYAVSGIALVPLLIGAWGVEGFGEWLALTALTSYLSYSSFGLMTTTVNEIVMAVGAGDRDRALRAYQMSLNCTFYIVLPILVVMVIVAFSSPLTSVFKLASISPDEVNWIITLQAALVWIGAVKGILAATLYASGRYGQVYVLDGAMKLVELGAIAVAILLLHGGQVAAAAAMAGIGLIDLALLAFYKHRVCPWATSNFALFDRSWLVAQVKPGIGFALANFTTQGVLVQGPRLVLGMLLGGGAVAVYAVYATAMRLTDQAVLLLAYPLEVEVARSAGRNEPDVAYKLIAHGTQFAIAAFLCVAAGLMLFGPFIFELWTTGRIPFSYTLMAMFLAMSACNQIGRISAHALIGTNRMYGPAAYMLPSGLVALAFGALLCRELGVPGMVVGGIVGELAVSLIVISAATEWLGRRGSQFFRDLFDFGAFSRSVKAVSARLGMGLGR